MHVLAGINYNHQAPDEAAKLVRCFSCLKRRVAPTPPALARSTYETAGRSPASPSRNTRLNTRSHEESAMFSTIDVRVARAHINQLNELADAKRSRKADRH